MLATGDGWIASLDQMRGLLSVYDETGRPLGRLPLTRILSTSPMGLQAIHGMDDLLGVGHDLSVTTSPRAGARCAAVHRDPSSRCTAPPRRRTP